MGVRMVVRECFTKVTRVLQGSYKDWCDYEYRLRLRLPLLVSSCEEARDVRRRTEGQADANIVTSVMRIAGLPSKIVKISDCSKVSNCSKVSKVSKVSQISKIGKMSKLSTSQYFVIKTHAPIVTISRVSRFSRVSKVSKISKISTPQHFVVKAHAPIGDKQNACTCLCYAM
jgi:hypothetical protein